MMAMMMPRETEVRVGGGRLRMDREDVIQKLRGVTPGRIQTHAVDVEGRLYPVKEAFHVVTGADVLDFNTNQARSVFKRLGFEVGRDMIDMKSLPDLMLKKLATSSGPKQYLAFDELARRIRDNPSSRSPEEEPWVWNPLDIIRAPSAIEAEWAFLKWSQQLNDGKNPKLEQEQEARLDELESHLDQDPDSLENKYFNAIGAELRRQKGESSA